MTRRLLLSGHGERPPVLLLSQSLGILPHNHGDRGFNRHTVGLVKRRADQHIKANSDMDATLDKLRGGSHPLAFYREELLGVAPSSSIPLLVRARMENFDVRRILVDQGRSIDIM